MQRSTAKDNIMCEHKFQCKPRACLKNVNTPKQRSFFRHTSPIFLEIHPVFLRKIVFVWRKNFSPLCIFPLFKRRLILFWGTMAQSANTVPQPSVRCRTRPHTPSSSSISRYALHPSAPPSFPLYQLYYDLFKNRERV